MWPVVESVLLSSELLPVGLELTAPFWGGSPAPLACQLPGVEDFPLGWPALVSHHQSGVVILWGRNKRPSFSLSSLSELGLDGGGLREWVEAWFPVRGECRWVNVKPEHSVREDGVRCLWGRTDIVRREVFWEGLGGFDSPRTPPTWDWGSFANYCPFPLSLPRSFMYDLWEERFLTGQVVSSLRAWWAMEAMVLDSGRPIFLGPWSSNYYRGPFATSN